MRLEGPAGTPYAGGMFQIRIRATDGYPMEPPEALFATPIFHTHVHCETGQISYDHLNWRWSPALRIPELCESIRAMLGRASAAVNVDSEACRMFGSTPMQYLTEARRWSQEYANAPDASPWDCFPFPLQRIPIDRVFVRLVTGRIVSFDVDDTICVRRVKQMVLDRHDSPGSPQQKGCFQLIGQGMFLADDKSLRYYGIGNDETLVMTLRSNLMDSEDLLGRVYGPNVPLVTVYLTQVERDDGNLDVIATSVSGDELARMTTTLGVMWISACSAILGKIPSAAGRLQLFTQEGTVWRNVGWE